MKKIFSVRGMTCAVCAGHVEKSLLSVSGVQSAVVNLASNTAKVEYDEMMTNETTLKEAVSKAGYRLCEYSAGDDSSGEEKGLLKRFWISLVFLIFLIYLSMGHMLNLPLPEFIHKTPLVGALLQLCLTLPIIIINFSYFKNGFAALKGLHPNMFSLIAIGSSAAFLYSLWVMVKMIFFPASDPGHLYFESSATILTLITLGKYLESKSKSKTEGAIKKLISLTPKRALVLRDGKETDIAAEDLAVGDTVIVKSGESIPADGIITEGNASIDESAITGESMPAEKAAGDFVCAATVNLSGYFKFRVEKTGEDMTITQIVRLVEEASATKAPIGRMADKVSAVFVPAVSAIALIAAIIWYICTGDFEFALSILISVLVISCPCALGLATPVAIIAGTGKAAEKGILIKSAAALEAVHKVDTLVLDKTGTVTEGKPQVVFTDADKDCLAIAAGLEGMSEHPLAKAVTKYSENLKVTPAKIESFTAIDGRGISGIYDKKTCLMGNLKMMAENNIELPQLDFDGETVLCLAVGGVYMCHFKIADSVKKSSYAAMERFKKLGLDVVMLTGDNKKAAEKIRSELDIKKAVAEVLPADKEKYVRGLQEEKHFVAMVGDGINDSPALARADVGIAIGAGTDIAMESADVVLVKSNLCDIASLIELSRKVIRTIKQNLFWAFFYNAICIPVAAGALYPIFGIMLSPSLAAAAMSLSSVCVVTNSLRIRFSKAM